jgi:hypothetical protein
MRSRGKFLRTNDRLLICNRVGDGRVPCQFGAAVPVPRQWPKPIGDKSDSGGSLCRKRRAAASIVAMISLDVRGPQVSSIRHLHGKLTGASR